MRLPRPGRPRSSLPSPEARTHFRSYTGWQGKAKTSPFVKAGIPMMLFLVGGYYCLSEVVCYGDPSQLLTCLFTVCGRQIRESRFQQEESVDQGVYARRGTPGECTSQCLTSVRPPIRFRRTRQLTVLTSPLTPENAEEVEHR